MPLDTAGLAQTLATIDPRETIRPAAFDTTVGDGPPLEANLAPLGPRLVMGDTIGQGGMAIVRAAKQTSLGRDVAVKLMRRDATADATPRVLREAWITGALEHPNIVPVHDLGVDERGRPMIILKRIEGRPWSDLIGRHDEIRARFGIDPLDWNLQQLVHVCNAIAFAHSRGIVHRDLKPSNVMIGEFGEVYVLDWGIAVSLVDDGTGRLPLADDCTEVAGTLAYMAPEMLGEPPVTERTDVYLLGAVLYEIVTGSPPHAHGSIAATIESIATSEPVFAADLPTEVIEICRRALAREPTARYASADELRAAIVAFLEHRGSAEIAGEALRRLHELEALLASKPDRGLAYQLFGQCRFGFQAALRAWRDNASARDSLDRALSLMASYELDHGDPRAAAVLVADLAVPQPALAARLEQAQHDATERARRLARLEIDQDDQRGVVARAAFLILFGLMWVALPLVGALSSTDVDGGSSVIFVGISIVAVIGFGVIARGSMLRTHLNRGVLLTTLIALVLHGIVEGTAALVGVDVVFTHMLALALWSGACGISAVFLERMLVLPTLAFLAALVATELSPALRFWATSAGCAVLLATVLYLWFRLGRGRRTYGLADLLRRADD